MDTYTITWRGEVFGDLKITAETADKAKAKLASMPRSELIKHSRYYNNFSLVELSIFVQHNCYPLNLQHRDSQQD